MTSLRSLIIAASAILSSTALATGYETTGSVTLNGHVDSILNLSVSPTQKAEELPCDGAGAAGIQQMWKVADLVITTNNDQGYTLVAHTAGSLAKTVGGVAAIPFQVVTTDEGVMPTSESFTVASGSDYSYVGTNQKYGDRDLFILYTPDALQDPGEYAGLIELSVSDN